MSQIDLASFFRLNVPYHCTSESAVLEHAARARGFQVDRLDNASIWVKSNAATWPFHGLKGPDVSYVGVRLSKRLPAIRALDSANVIAIDDSPEVDGAQTEIFVVDGTVIFAGRTSTKASLAGEPTTTVLDVTDDLDQAVAEVALATMSVIPGVPYGAVTVSHENHSKPRLRDFQIAPSRNAYLPVDGEVRDIGGAILKHYADRERVG